MPDVRMPSRAELRALPDSALLAQLRRLPRDSIGREAICEILVSRYTGLVRSCVRPYLQSPEPTEDLLQRSDDPAMLSDILGEDDPAVAHAIDIEAVRVHLDELPEREQRVLIWRFYGNLTQSQIGDRLGISQMHVSRLLDRALTYLRAQITGPA